MLLEGCPTGSARWRDYCLCRKRVPVKAGGFRWRHPIESAELVQISKSARIASGLRAALALADLGHTPEAATLLRTIADFSAEIIFLGEGILEGRLTSEQTKFVEQHFADLPLSADELAEREREYYVGRNAIAKAHARIFEKHGGDKDLFAKLAAYLNKGYDSYVHGSYHSAMEMFAGDTMTFMLTGSRSDYQRCMSKTAVAGKLVESLHALRFMAIIRGLEQLQEEIGRAAEDVDAAGEQSGIECRGRR